MFVHPNMLFWIYFDAVLMAPHVFRCTNFTLLTVARYWWILMFFMVVECSCICVKSSTFVRLDAMYWRFLVHPPIRWQCDSCDSCAEETLNGSQLLQLVKESFDIHLISKKILSWKSSEIWIYHIHRPDTDNIRLISSMLTSSNLLNLCVVSFSGLPYSISSVLRL